MRVRVIAVGTRMPAWVRSACQDYLARLGAHLAVAVLEIEPGARTAGGTPAKAIATEAKRLLAALRPASTWWRWTSAAASSTTRELAAWLGTRKQAGEDLALLIGGPDGLAPEVLARGQLRAGRCPSSRCRTRWRACCSPSSSTGRTASSPTTRTTATDGSTNPQRSCASPRRRRAAGSCWRRSACRTPRQFPTSTSRCSPGRPPPTTCCAWRAPRRSPCAATPGPLPVLGADTIVVLDGAIFGKPRERCRWPGHAWQAVGAHAHRCSPRWRWPRTRPAPGSRLSASEVTLPRAQPRGVPGATGNRGEPRDKAGGYAVQGRAAIFIEHLQRQLFWGRWDCRCSRPQQLLCAAGMPCLPASAAAAAHHEHRDPGQRRAARDARRACSRTAWCRKSTSSAPAAAAWWATSTRAASRA